MKSRLKTELQKELSYLEGYRKRTAQLAMQVLDNIEDVNVFLEMESSLTVVKDLLNEDEYRLQDVAKMLNVLLGHLIKDDNISDEMKQKLAERKLRKKGYRLELE
ncbi:hypothetical protein ACIQZM_18110 [Peribacillus sp. NPDC097206]|uniref:hypothetical protein n=1 Tax=unclassified Peribacillus TaxID=2675266 RepID=UPI0037FF9AD1